MANGSLRLRALLGHRIADPHRPPGPIPDVHVEVLELEGLRDHGAAECLGLGAFGDAGVDVAGDEDDTILQLRAMQCDPRVEIEAGLAAEPDVDERACY